MSRIHIDEQGLRYVPMTWEQYLDLPEDARAEWVDGVAVMKPQPFSMKHGAAVVSVCSALMTALTTPTVLIRSSVWLLGNRLRAPDVTVVASFSDTAWVEEPPVLVVEVLSPSTWAEDTVVKSVEYAAGGVGQFWVVDPDHRSIDVYTNAGGYWVLLLHLDEQQTTGEVTVGPYGAVPLDLDAILPT